MFLSFFEASVMYLPADFLASDQGLLHDLMERFGFATLITVVDGKPLVTHLPLLVDRDSGEYGRLIGHMARANRQWESFDRAGEALVIFQGEHGYISPSWYEPQPSVPTWNYLVVHAYGTPRLIEDDAGKRKVLRSLVTKHEARLDRAWPMDLPEPYLKSMMQQIVAFEIPITRLEGKFKLSQNRSRQDQARVVAALAASTDPSDQALAAAMQRVLGMTDVEPGR